jgi:hypothetical protein
LDYHFPDLPPERDPDALTHTVGIAQEFALFESRMLLEVGYSHSFQNADGTDYEADFDRIGLSVSYYPLVWDIRVLGSVSWTRGDYENGNSLDLSGRVREDEVWSGAIRLERRLKELWEPVTVYVGVGFSDNESNVDFYDFDRMVYNFGFTLSF